MPLTRILFLSLPIIIVSCHGQTKSQPASTITNQKPLVMNSGKAASLAPDFDNTLVSQYIRSIYQDSKGNMWFGTIADGVVRYDEKTLTYFSKAEGFVCSSVFAIHEDKNGNMWFGTDQGVYKYDGRTFKNYHQKDGLNQIEISRKGILVDRSGTIWVGTHRGVYQYHPLRDYDGGKCFDLFPLLPSINVAGMMEDNTGNIWFASSDQGVFRYDGKTIVHFNQKEKMGENYAGGIAQDRNGNMWFTMKNGICRFDGKSFKEYTSKDGLGGTEFWGILIERSGIIWITARGSTTRFDPSLSLPDKKAFTVFTAADGFTCCVQSMFQDKSGKLWFGTGQGLYRFDGKRFFQVRKDGPW